MSYDFNEYLPPIIAERLTNEDYDYSKVLNDIMIAYHELIAGHHAGLITYHPTETLIILESDNYDRKLKHYMTLVEELQRLSSEEIVLDKIPRKPQEIAKELLKKIAFQNKDNDTLLTAEQSKNVLNALGFLNRPKQTEEEKELLHLIELIPIR